MVEAMALLPMEVMLDLGLAMVVATVALCTEVLMVHTEHMVLVPMVVLLTVVVPMVVVLLTVVVPMVVVPQVAMVQPVGMVVMGELGVLLVGVQVVVVLAGTILMGNNCQLTQGFSRMQ
jgi:hypothetical protein